MTTYVESSKSMSCGRRKRCWEQPFFRTSQYWDAKKNFSDHHRQSKQKCFFVDSGVKLLDIRCETLKELCIISGAHTATTSTSAYSHLSFAKATAVNATPVSPQKAVPQATESTEPCHNFCLLFLFCVVKASSHIDADLGRYLFGRELRAWDQLNILRVWKTCYFRSLHVVICFWLPAWRHSCNFPLNQMTTWLEVQNQTPQVAQNMTPQAAQVSCLQVLMYLVSDANGQISRQPILDTCRKIWSRFGFAAHCWCLLMLVHAMFAINAAVHALH